MQARKPHVCALRHWIRLCAFLSYVRICPCMCVYMYIRRFIRTGHRGDDSSSYTQCLSSSKPFFLYFLSTTFLLLLLLFLLFLLRGCCFSLLLASDDTKGNSFRTTPVQASWLWSRYRGWGIVVSVFREKVPFAIFNSTIARARNAASTRLDTRRYCLRKPSPPAATFIPRIVANLLRGNLINELRLFVRRFPRSRVGIPK